MMSYTLTPALRRLRQEEDKFKPRLSYKIKPVKTYSSTCSKIRKEKLKISPKLYLIPF